VSRYRLVWAPEGKTLGYVEANSAKAARAKSPMPYRKYKGEIIATLEGYRGVIWAKDGKLLLGGAKSVASSWFATRQEAEDWLYAMRSGQEGSIDLAEIEER
jgi:hypothetical protein